MRYALMMIAGEPEPGQVKEELIATMQAAFNKYAHDLHAAGVLVSADILTPSSTATTLSMRDGRATIQDGPYAATKEQLAGVFLIEVPDLDAALAWAEACPGAHYGHIELRPSALTVRDGQWRPPH
ncbi:YciI family protein [Roseateles sp. DXS20W]|uniref:YciI family protein n=1 Tax=Pelomonas lactea TaxID=3299030 RepID=A0ABW7GH13_9BURK